MDSKEIEAENNILKQHIALLNYSIDNVIKKFSNMIIEQRFTNVNLVDMSIQIIALENAMNKEYSLSKEISILTKRDAGDLYDDILFRLAKCEVDIKGLRGEYVE